MIQAFGEAGLAVATGGRPVSGQASFRLTLGAGERAVVNRVSSVAKTYLDPRNYRLTYHPNILGMNRGQLGVKFIGPRRAIAPVRGAGTSGASNVNARAALRSKLSALENAQNTAARTRTLPDGRIWYYEAETPARTAGPTRGASYVTEYNPQTGQVRSWMESYDHAGNVTRVHPKMINGQTVNAPHYPPTGKELGQ